MNDSHIKKDSPFAVIIWAIYDFANTMYSMNVVSLYFPLVITVNLGFPDMWVSAANSISMAIILLTMPLFGTLSDRIGRRMPFLWVFTIISVVATYTIGLALRSGFSSQTTLLLICLSFILANFGYHGGLVFYNTLLDRVATPKKQGRISGIGVAIGYIGSIFGMLMVLPFNEGNIFGLDIPFIAGGGRQATFLPTAILFMLFALPTLIYFRERGRISRIPKSEADKPSLRLIWQTLTDNERYPGFGRFLLANFFFNDGVQTAIIFMAVFARKVLGLPDGSVTAFFVVSTIGAFIGAIVIGKLSDKLRHKRTLIFVLIGWIIALAILASFPVPIVLWLLGMPFGALLGGVWTCSRPIVLKLSPKGDEGRYFGLYAFSGKLAAIKGPLTWGAITLALSPISEQFAYRMALISLAIFIAIGAWLLKGLEVEAAEG